MASRLDNALDRLSCGSQSSREDALAGLRDMVRSAHSRLPHAAAEKDDPDFAYLRRLLELRNADCPPQLGVELLIQRARRLASEGDYSGTARFADKAYELSHGQFGPKHDLTAQSLEVGASALNRLAEHSEAARMYDQALSIRLELHGSDDPSLVCALQGLAWSYHAVGNFYDATTKYEAALAIMRRTGLAKWPDATICLGHLGDLYEHYSRYEEAAAVYRLGLGVCKRTAGRAHLGIVVDWLNRLARIYESDQWRWYESIDLYERAHAICTEALGPNHSRTIEALGNLARTCEINGYFEKAELTYGEMLSACERASGSEHAETAVRLTQLARLHEQLCQVYEADIARKRAEEIWETILVRRWMDAPTDVSWEEKTEIEDGTRGCTVERLPQDEKAGGGRE